MQRSTFLKSMLLGGLVPWTAIRWREATHPGARFFLAHPWPDLSVQIPEPLPIASLYLEPRGEELFVVARAENGAEGRTLANTRMPYLVSLFEKLVAPFFIGKDARQLSQWIAEIYLDDRNYKYSGMPFSCCVGHAEIALWDLLGKVAQKPVFALLSTPLRHEVPVYLSSLTRNNSAEEEVARIQARLDETQTQAVKFKIGGRMKNDAASEARTLALVPLLRKPWATISPSTPMPTARMKPRKLFR
ncbi:MAG: hypothetical protein HC913_04585 [Microscillaceae bacterium]|nr:hypothetical protein [Microscillaceae bacterium]